MSFVLINLSRTSERISERTLSVSAATYFVDTLDKERMVASSRTCTLLALALHTKKNYSEAYGVHFIRHSQNIPCIYKNIVPSFTIQCGAKLNLCATYPYDDAYIG